MKKIKLLVLSLVMAVSLMVTVSCKDNSAIPVDNSEGRNIFMEKEGTEKGPLLRLNLKYGATTIITTE